MNESSFACLFVYTDPLFVKMYLSMPLYCKRFTVVVKFAGTPNTDV